MAMLDPNRIDRSQGIPSSFGDDWVAPGGTWTARVLWGRMWGASRELPPYMLRVLHLLAVSDELVSVNRIGQDVAAFLREIGLVRGEWVGETEQGRHYFCSLSSMGERYVLAHPQPGGALAHPVTMRLSRNRTLIISSVDETANPTALVCSIKAGWAACVEETGDPLRVKSSALNAAIANSAFVIDAAPELVHWPRDAMAGFAVLFGPARYTYRLSLGCACCGAPLPERFVSWSRARDSMRPFAAHLPGRPLLFDNASQDRSFVDRSQLNATRGYAVCTSCEASYTRATMHSCHHATIHEPHSLSRKSIA